MICRSRVQDRDLPIGVTFEPITTRAQIDDYARIAGRAYAIYGAPSESTASHLGAANVQLQASEMGEPVYRRMGYEELYRYRLYLQMPPA